MMIEGYPKVDAAGYYQKGFGRAGGGEEEGEVGKYR
ncbi:MAG: hypothetical protein QG635_368 [Bacteroidota bacterium]|nr:hypothetical protein [Bacteroidota bacterium]